MSNDKNEKIIVEVRDPVTEGGILLLRYGMALWIIFGVSHRYLDKTQYSQFTAYLLLGLLFLAPEVKFILKVLFKIIKFFKNLIIRLIR